MQVPLYEAVIAVGRMAEDVRKFGWACGTLGQSHGPKCVNGGLTMAFGAVVPYYIDEWAQRRPENREAIKLASVALVQTLDETLKYRLAKHCKEIEEDGRCSENDANSARELIAGLARPEEVSDLVVLESILFQANDEEEDGRPSYLDVQSVLAWYERAQDKLAEGLPEPIPALTVERTLSTMPVIA